MFIRKKKIKNNEYVYLVENRYNKIKKQSRQKTRRYLGRAIKIDSNDQTFTKALTIKEAIINELLSKGFRKEKTSLTKGRIVIDLNLQTVKENDKNVCLEINDGFLCKETLTNLINFNINNLTQKQVIKRLASSFILAGIKIHHESFVEIYNSLKS